MAIRAVVFDLFHTLTRRESEWSNLPWTSDALGIARTTWYEALTKRSRWRLAGHVTDPIEIVRSLALEIDPTLTEEAILAAAGYRQARFQESLSRIPAANVAVLDELRRRGLLLGLISNADVSEIASYSRCPLAGCFDSEIFSCAVGAVKPEPEIYRASLTALGVEPAECVFVGDGGSDELKGAREVGLYAVLMSGVIEEMWPERIPTLAQDADAHIRSLSELLGLPILQPS